MTFTPVENRSGIQPIAQSNAALPSQYQTGQSPFFGQAHPLGTIVKAYDPTFGEGEFIYLLGVANTLVGSLVTWDATTFQTALATNTANQDVPVAVAMSANLAGQYGWYQIGGLAQILKTAVTVNPQVSLFMSGTNGRVKVLASAGRQILGCKSANLSTVTSTTSLITALINRPFLQGQIT